MSGSGRYQVDIVRTRSALAALASEWDALAMAIGLPTLGHAWVVCCATTLYHEHELHIVTVRLGGALAGAAPLVTRVRAGGVRLELIGVSHLHEPSGLLYDTNDALEALVRAIVATRLPVMLARIPAQSPVIARWRAVGSGCGAVVVVPVAGCVATPITSAWAEYHARLSSSRRYVLRRARRRTEEAGLVTVRLQQPRPDDVERLFAEFVTVESASWKSRHGSSLKERDGLRRFFLSYATAAAQAGGLRFAALDVDGTAIAAQLSVEYAARLWVLKIGYDESWSRCSPGWQLLGETMRDAFERRLEAYEFLGSDESWLHGWITEPRDFSVLVWYPWSWRGVHGFVADTCDRVRARASAWMGRAVRPGRLEAAEPNPTE